MFPWIVGLIACIILVRTLYSVWQYPAIELTLLSTLMKEGDMEGPHLRGALSEQGFLVSSVRFYAIMSRLENEAWVEGWYQEKKIEDITIKIRWYRLKEEGGKRITSRQLSRAVMSLLPSPI